MQINASFPIQGDRFNCLFTQIQRKALVHNPKQKHVRNSLSSQILQLNKRSGWKLDLPQFSKGRANVPNSCPGLQAGLAEQQPEWCAIIWPDGFSVRGFQCRRLQRVLKSRLRRKKTPTYFGGFLWEFYFCMSEVDKEQLNLRGELDLVESEGNSRQSTFFRLVCRAHVPDHALGRTWGCGASGQPEKN